MVINSKKLILFALLIIVIISSAILFIFTKRNNPSIQPFSEETLVYEIGSFTQTDDKSVLYFPAILKDVRIEDNKVISTVESKNKSGETFNKEVVNLVEGRNNYLYLNKLSKLNDINEFKLEEISNKEVAEKALKKYINQYVLLTVHLSPVLKLDFPNKYKEYVTCNDNLFDYATANTPMKNCDAFSPEIRVYDKDT